MQHKNTTARPDAGAPHFQQTAFSIASGAADIAGQFQQRTAYSIAVEVVSRTFPGRGYLDWKEACNYLGLSVNTANDLLTKSRFPVSVSRNGTKKLIPVFALIEYETRKYLALGYPADPNQPAPLPPVYMPQELAPGSNGRGCGRLRRGAERAALTPKVTTASAIRPARLSAAGRPSKKEQQAALAAGFQDVKSYRAAQAEANHV